MYKLAHVFQCISLIGNRGCRSEWRGQIFDRKFLNSCFCHARWKYAQNSLTVLSNGHNFSPFIRNRGRWTRWWGPILDRKQDWCYFCACALKKLPKHSENVFRQKSYSPVTGNRGRRSERQGQIFDRKLVNRRFCACAVKNRPKTRILCCQITKILAHLWAIAVAEHDGI